MKYEIIHEETVYEGFLNIRKASVVYDSFAGEKINATREALDSGDVVAILLHEKDTDTVLLTRQFRYPAHAGTSGWLIELPAGKVETGDTPLSRAAQEIREEIGYIAHNLQELFVFYTSPGTSTERIFLFYGETTQPAQTTAGGGAATDPKEDIELHKLPVSAIQEFLDTHQTRDAKTIIALQWMLQHTRK